MDFAERVYGLLLEIPKGKVTTYADIAAALGSRKLARAVGNALHKNPDGEKYPCFKVVNAAGKLSESYAFGGILAQTRRLEKEGIEVIKGKVDLKKYGVAFSQGEG